MKMRQTPPRTPQRSNLSRHGTPGSHGSGDTKTARSPMRSIMRESPTGLRIPTCTEVEEEMGIIHRCVKVSEGTNTDPDVFGEQLYKELESDDHEVEGAFL